MLRSSTFWCHPFSHLEWDCKSFIKFNIKKKSWWLFLLMFNSASVFICTKQVITGRWTFWADLGSGCFSSLPFCGCLHILIWRREKERRKAAILQFRVRRWFYPFIVIFIQISHNYSTMPAFPVYEGEIRIIVDSFENQSIETMYVSVSILCFSSPHNHSNCCADTSHIHPFKLIHTPVLLPKWDVIQLWINFTKHHSSTIVYAKGVLQKFQKVHFLK